MPYGIGAALTWALDTVILSIALSSSVFSSSAQAVALAAFTSTFLHDACSALFTLAYMLLKRKASQTLRALRTREGLVILGAALIGGPIGMTGYVIAIDNIGASYTAAISSFFPAFGALLATVFLKERMKSYQWAGLLACILGVAYLGYSPAPNIPGDWTTGIVGALICVFGWGSEAVIIDWGLHNASIDDECAMQIRQTTSSLAYALVILPLLGGWGRALDIVFSSALPVIALAALAGTVSYLLYYKAIARIGASRAMALNITYSAWAIPFSLLLLGVPPRATRSRLCAGHHPRSHHGSNGFQSASGKETRLAAITCRHTRRVVYKVDSVVTSAPIFTWSVPIPDMSFSR
jgi:drug/metabolite transporter (DMT)-like permease